MIYLIYNMIFLIFIIQGIFSKNLFHIKGHSKLEEHFKAGIDFNIGNIGEVPYGKTI